MVAGILDKPDRWRVNSAGVHPARRVLPRQVRLIAVPAARGHRRRTLPGIEQAAGVLEAQHPGRGLRGHPDLLAETRHQVAVATPDLLGQITDPQLPAAAAQLGPRPPDLRRRRRPRADPVAQQLIQHTEPLGPGPRGRQLVGPAVRRASQQLAKFHRATGDLVHRDAEQRERRQRVETDLDAVLAPVMGGGGRGVVQPGHERGVAPQAPAGTATRQRLRPGFVADHRS